MSEQRYTYTLHDDQKPTGDGFPLSEEGGPATEQKIEELMQRHYAAPCFVEDDDGRILIFRSQTETADMANAVGEVVSVE